MNQSRRCRAFAALLLVLSCCRSSPYADPGEWGEADLLEAARGRFADQAYEAAAEMTEALVERTGDSRVIQEALYLAGESRFQNDQLKKAFRHYQTLMEDYPYSQFLPSIEAHVYAIGTHYLDASPSAIFGDLFSGRPFGVEVMRSFTIAFRHSDLADDATALSAEYYFGREEFDLAADKYTFLVEEYPRSEWYDLAAYRVGLSHLRFSRGAGYEEGPLLVARREFLRYLTERPGEFRAQAEAGLEEAEQALAEGELNTARFYLLRQQDRGARIHLANVVLQYPATEAAAAARVELANRGWDVSLNSVERLPP